MQRSFPHALATLLQEILRPVPDFDRIAQVIKLDPAMTANVLSLVNSPFYGLGQKVLDIKHAAVILGTREILKIALSISLVNAYSKKKNGACDLRTWRTTVWSALAAQALAEHHCPEKGDLTYLSALLKDLALLFAGDEPTSAENSPGLVIDGSDAGPSGHARLSCELLREHDLPQDMLEAILHHHDIDGLKACAPLTQCVIMGTKWAEMELSADVDPPQLINFKYVLRDHFSIAEHKYEDIRAEVLRRFTSLTKLLNLTNQESDSRLTSLMAIQRLFFLSLDLMHVSGGPEALAKIIQKHLRLQWNLQTWELGLKWARERQWSLYRCHQGEALCETQAYVLPQDLAWTYQGHRFALTSSGRTWGELRIPKKNLNQDTLFQLGYYTRFLSQALEQYAQRTAALEDKARILDKLPIGVAWLNASGKVMDANPSLRRLLGVDVVHGKDLYPALNANELVRTESPWRSFIEDAQQTSMNALFCPPPLTKDLSTPCLYLSAHKIVDANRKDILVLLEDIKDITELQARLLKQRNFLRGLINSMQDVILTTDAHGKITFISSQLSPNLLGKNLFTITKPSNRDTFFTGHKAHPPV
jgi:PAS domain-containing protein